MRDAHQHRAVPLRHRFALLVLVLLCVRIQGGALNDGIKTIAGMVGNARRPPTPCCSAPTSIRSAGIGSAMRGALNDGIKTIAGMVGFEEAQPPRDAHQPWVQQVGKHPKTYIFHNFL
ncbi:hypothetical protein HaLaN_12836, partial [Haematococcus lacustris]